MSVTALLATWALSHGAAPTAVDILIADGEAPRLIRLSRGVALMDGAAPTLLCPTRWGGPDSPPMARAGDRVFVAGFRGLHSLAVDGSLTAIATPVPLDGASTRILVGDGTRAAGLDTDGNIVVLSPGEPRIRATLTPSPDSIAFLGSEILAVAVENDVLTLSRMDQTEGATSSIPVAVGYPGTPTLAVVDGVVFVRGASPNAYWLDRLDTDLLTRLVDSIAPIQGPVAHDGQLYLVIDGAPHRLDGDTPVALAAGPRITCIRSQEPLGLTACTFPDIVRLGSDGTYGETLFTFADLLPPSLEGLDELDTKSCQVDWYDIAGDAGFPEDRLIPEAWRPGAADPGPEVAEPGPEPSPASTDCQSGRTPSSGTGFILMTALCLLVRRRQRTPGLFRQARWHLD